MIPLWIYFSYIFSNACALSEGIKKYLTGIIQWFFTIALQHIHASMKICLLINGTKRLQDIGINLRYIFLWSLIDFALIVLE